MTWLEKLTTNPAITEALPEAVVETLLMVAISGVATVLIG
ncbi:metal ABC transporter permease, partial [Xanthomonas citri pv. citri]|nr:metal ABC transporter permease [Xanthomonas citri pv. citri]